MKDKKRYGDLQEIERYMADALAGEKARNVVPLRAAIGGAGELASTGVPGAAATTMGLTAMQKSFHPATAQLLNKMEKLMASRFGEAARESLRRGPKAFASWDFMMQQMDPSYREFLQGGPKEAQ